MKSKRSRVRIVLSIVIPVAVLLSVVLCVTGYYVRASEMIGDIIKIANYRESSGQTVSNEIISEEDLLKLKIHDPSVTEGISWRRSNRCKVMNLSPLSIEYDVRYKVAEVEGISFSLKSGLNIPQKTLAEGHWYISMEFYDFRWHVKSVTVADD